MDLATAPAANAPPSDIIMQSSALDRVSVRNLRLARARQVIADVPDFTLVAGETVALVGPSGSGKTTALMALALMHPPAAGSIAIGGVEPWRLSNRARDRFRGSHIGLIFQSFHLVDALSVQANIALAARCIRQPVDRQRLDSLLARLGLAEIATQRADCISHGQAQRVAVARALMNRPTVILADEPTSALDDANAESLLHLLKDCAAAENAGLLITTHDRRILDTVDRTVRLGAPV